jgi:hypothetical protein
MEKVLRQTDKEIAKLLNDKNFRFEFYFLQFNSHFRAEYARKGRFGAEKLKQLEKIQYDTNLDL